MRRRRQAFSVAFATLALGACGGSNEAGSPGDVTVSEAKALDEAAEMIEAHRPPAGLVAPSAPLPPSVQSHPPPETAR